MTLRETVLVRWARVLFVTLAFLFVAVVTRAATITIVNLDGPGEGFNDPTPAAPVGGNPGTTIGAQRLYVFQYAANVWGAILPDPIEVLVDSNFDPLTCDGSSAVLGSAGPTFIESDFPNADKTSTWYHVALANRLAGEDLEPGSSDITAQFNSDIGKPECFPAPWYYGVDGNEGTAIELLPVVIHELGHGLGFSTSTIAGVEEVFPSIYDYFLYDRTLGMHWPDMTDGQRSASSQNCNNLVWDGPSVKLQSPDRLGPKPLLRINSPSTIAGDYEVGLANFGPALTLGGVTGDLVLAMDGMGVPTNGCEPFTNAAQVNGKIALIDRGACTFVTKVLNAQAAGAIAAVIADSMPGCPPAGLGGTDPTITIPAVRVTQDVGARLKTALLLGAVNGTLRLDPALKAGGGPDSTVQVYTPLPYQTGSSVSHWDVSCSPDLLMEPALNSSLSRDVDLTRPAFADIGWYKGYLAVGDQPSHRRLEHSFPNPTSSGTTIAYTLPRDAHVTLGVYDAMGRLVTHLADGNESEGRHQLRWDGTDLSGRHVAPGIYHYRLKVGSDVEGDHVVKIGRAHV